MNTESPSQSLILASSSKYRKLLLQRLGIPFDCISPEVDERAHNGETPADLALRLAAKKASAVATGHPAATVIGSDQLAVFDNTIIGKPGTHAAAAKQLRSFSGQTVDFLTAVTVTCGHSHYTENHLDHTKVCFRNLSDNEIERYLLREKPYDCAGAFKAEALGVTLFRQIENSDPTAIIGLPLIQTAKMLRKAGFQLP